ncbi:MAG: 30S ribosomal protein S17 [Candidatus Levybacteria bacterium]|nr:30S ribosomal protein S17 [Candidatus Levybacteria bacterium]
MKKFDGIVVSAKTQNTAIVSVSRKIRHPLYKKLLTRTKNFKADTDGIAVTIGQTVQIMETRPISKDKHFKILKVVDKTPRIKLIGEEKAMHDVLGEDKKIAISKDAVLHTVDAKKKKQRRTTRLAARQVVVRKRKE